MSEWPRERAASNQFNPDGRIGMLKPEMSPVVSIFKPSPRSNSKFGIEGDPVALFRMYSTTDLDLAKTG